MHQSLLGLLILVLLFGGSYMWYEAQATCPIPIAYQLGEMSTSFGISKTEAQQAISEAESLWEDATGINLFTRTDDARLTINFLFDERQQFTNAEEALSRELERARDVNEAVESQYAELVTEYTKLNEQYTTRRTAYERSLNTYNKEVAQWNEQGGAPQEVYDELNKRKEAIDAEQQALDAVRQQLNALVDKINELSEEANEIIERYNQGVETYNDAFSEATEFTQGDFQGKSINIYQFKNHEELVLVLAHEFGHALGLDHVENASSIMYQQMGEQQLTIGLTAEDKAAFVAECGDGSTLSKLKFW